MQAVSFLKGLAQGLVGLGARRLFALALSGLTVFVLVGVSGYYLSRPERDILYSGLDAQDVTRIGAALEEAGIAFDVNVTGDTVLVDYGKTARACRKVTAPATNCSTNWVPSASHRSCSR